jgi:tellurite resistance protein
VRNEFANPVTGPLFGTPVISLLLLPLLLAEFSLPLARALWCVGTIAMIVLAGLIVDRWISHRQENPHAVPAWFVPVVGMIEIPLAVPALHWTQLHGLMMFGLAIGLFFALPLFTIVFARLMFEAPIAPAMQPSLLILVAPFSVGFIAYVTTLDRIDTFAQALYVLMLFLLAVVLRRLRYLRKCCPFRVGWWAASFPLASSAGAAMRYAGFEGSAWTAAIALALLSIATGAILALLAFTIKGIVQGDLQRLSGP